MFQASVASLLELRRHVPGGVRMQFADVQVQSDCASHVQVLADPAADRPTRKLRAEALRDLGLIFQVRLTLLNLRWMCASAGYYWRNQTVVISVESRTRLIDCQAGPGP